ncbi:MAG: hypothetical protein ABEJ77_03595 [Halanaeroarchaeum sp.]
MIDAPTDVPPVWIALSIVSVAVLGVVLSVPTAPPPDAARVAEAVDAVASSEHAAAAAIPLEVASVVVTSRRVGVRTAGGTARATFLYGPVTPVERGTRLARVLHGTPPSAVFDTPGALDRAIERARERDPSWRTAPAALHVRRIDYGEVTDVLVGA